MFVFSERERERELKVQLKVQCNTQCSTKIHASVPFFSMMLFAEELHLMLASLAID